MLLLPVLVNFDGRSSPPPNRWARRAAAAFRQVLLPQIVPTGVRRVLPDCRGRVRRLRHGAGAGRHPGQILPLHLYSMISETGSDFPAAAALSLLLHGDLLLRHGGRRAGRGAARGAPCSGSIEPPRQLFDLAAGRRFDRARRTWRAGRRRDPGGPDRRCVAAATWLQRESGHPLRVPVGVIGPREATGAADDRRGDRRALAGAASRWSAAGARA